MTNAQLYLAIGVPLIVNSVTIMIVYMLLNQRINAVNDNLSAQMTIGFAAINQRFDDMRDLWRAELGRVEEVLDARLKHLEDHG